jgi:hypothetical protein
MISPMNLPSDGRRVRGRLAVAQRKPPVAPTLATGPREPTTRNLPNDVGIVKCAI